jgi:hypothetical protein
MICVACSQTEKSAKCYLTLNYLGREMKSTLPSAQMGAQSRVSWTTQDYPDSILLSLFNMDFVSNCQQFCQTQARRGTSGEYHSLETITHTCECLGTWTLKQVQVPTRGTHEYSRLLVHVRTGPLATFCDPIWVSGDQILVNVVSII